jgi:hypothetical protein
MNDDTPVETLDDIKDRKSPETNDALAQFAVSPVGGALVQTFGQQVDYAKYMSRGAVAIPSHLRANPGACLAVVDIAVRFGFSPYAVANQTYVQNERLCYMAQLVHAMIEASGRLQGRLRAEWTGEGDDRKCTVIGLIKGEKEPHKLTSERLGDLRPESVTKVKQGEEKTYVRGSPLWEKKPDIQLFYNTSRDWARVWLPEVLMGIYTPDEVEAIEEHRGPDNARDMGMIASLRDSAPAGTEGATPGHMASELDNVAAGAGNGQEAGAADAAVDAGAAEERTHGQESEATGKKKTKVAKPKPKSVAVKPKPKTAAKPPAKPKTLKEWAPYAIAVIKAAADADALEEWWKGDRALRNELGITADDRMTVETLKIDRVNVLRG